MKAARGTPPAGPVRWQDCPEDCPTGRLIFDTACAMRRWPKVSRHFVESLDRYFNYGYRPGGFLTACLQNNLTDAVSRADEEAVTQLADIVKLLFNDAPAVAWGDVTRIEVWCAEKAQERRVALDELRAATDHLGAVVGVPPAEGDQ